MCRLGKCVLALVLSLSWFSGMTANIDSLETLLPRLSGEKLIDAQNDLAWELKTTDPIAASVYASQALNSSEAIGYTLGTAYASNQLAILQRNAGKLDTAMKLFERSLEARYALKDSGMIGGVLLNIGRLFEKRGELYSATMQFEKASHFLNEVKDSERWAQLKQSIGVLYLKQGKYELAFQALSSALTAAKKGDHKKEMANCHLNIGTLYQSQREWDAALAAYEKALKSAIPLTDYQIIGKSHNNMGTIFFRKGNWAAAKKEYNLAIAAYDKSNDKVSACRLRLNSANLQLEMGNSEEAILMYKKALQGYRRIGLPLEVANTWHQIGRSLLHVDKREEAIVYLDSSLSVADSLNILPLQMQNYDALAETYTSDEAYQRAMYYQTLYQGALDSLWHRYQTSKALELKTKEQEKDLVQLQLDNEKIKAAQQQQSEFAKRRLLWNYFLSALLVAISLLFFVVFKLYKKHQQAKMAKKQQEISQQRITELVREQELKSMYATLDGQETERQRIAQELHDAVGSVLSMAKLYFQNMVEHLPETNDDFTKEYDKAINLLDDSVGEIRKISHNLASGVLSNLGLQTALEELIDSVKATGQLSVTYHMFGFQQRFPIATEMQLYRVLQELVANVLKHSQASQLTIQLIEKDDHLTIMVEDNGIGFDPAIKKGSIGLQNIKARLHKLGADLTLDTSLGRGTTVTIGLDIPNTTPLNIS